MAQVGSAPSKIVPFFELSRLLVVAVQSNGQLVCKGQTKPNGPWEANWTPVETVHSFGAMTAAVTGDGRVGVVAQPASGTDVLFIDEQQNALNVGWNPPVGLGKPPGVNLFTKFTMAYDTDGRLQVFGIDNSTLSGGGGRIWWKYQNPSRIVQKQVQVTPPGSKTPITVTVDEIVPPQTPWSDWYQLPGGLIDLIAKRNADGRITLFGINAPGDFYRDDQKTVPALQPSDWTGFVQMDTAQTGTVSAMTATLDNFGALNLFVINKGNQILHAWQNPPASSTWSSWTTPGLILPGVVALTCGVDGHGDIVVAANDKNLIHYANYQSSVAAQQWSGWIPFGWAGSPPWLALDYNADGRLSYFSAVLSGAPPLRDLYVLTQMKLDSTEWEYVWTNLASSNAGTAVKQYVVVRDLTPPT
jgi:hypothetical protein